MGAGDTEEHAVMLCNFLTHLEASGGGGPWRSFLVLGRAHPEGETVYVGRQAAGAPTGAGVLLINAVTGRSYHSSDDTCPLLSVGAVAAAGNMWANVQRRAEPSRLAWELDDPRAWAPLFPGGGGLGGAGGGPALPPVQPPLAFRPPDARLASALEAEIAGTLASALRAWRPRYVTRVRGDVSAALRPLLLELEARAGGAAGAVVLPTGDGLVQVAPGGVVTPVVVTAAGVAVGATAGPPAGGARDGRPPLPGAGAGGGAGGAGAGAGAPGGGGVRDVAAEHAAVIERAAGGRFRAHGSPLNVSFTDLDSLVDAVRRAGVHRVEDEAVQFAAAAIVVPYPNDVLSVWVYVVSLTPA